MADLQQPRHWRNSMTRRELVSIRLRMHAGTCLSTFWNGFQPTRWVLFSTPTVLFLPAAERDDLLGARHRRAPR